MLFGFRSECEDAFASGSSGVSKADPEARSQVAVSNSSNAVGTSSAPVIQRLTQEDSGST